MPRLRDLDAFFVCFTREVATWNRMKPEAMARGAGGPFADADIESVTGLRDGHEIEPYFELAHGVMFLCPLCFKRNGGEVGTHRVLCWFANVGVPDDADPKPGRWIPAGTCLDDLTFIGPAAASVLLTSGCRWHGFVRSGSAD